MHLLSVVGIKTVEGKRTTIARSLHSASSPWTSSPLKLIKKTPLILVCVFALVYLQIKEYAPLVSIQSTITQTLNPITQVLAKPFHWVSNISRYFENTDHMLAQIQQLKLQNDSLLRQQQKIQSALIENAKLKEALQVQSRVVDDIITVQITHHTFDGYAQTFYTRISDLDVLSKHNPVLTTTGYLVGRVLDMGQGIGPSSSKLTRIMPITDPASRIPVKIEGTNEHAVLKGKGQHNLELIYMENPNQLVVGQKLVTSGIGGIFPAEIPVAQITQVGGTVLAAPLGQLNDQEFALILTQGPSSP